MTTYQATILAETNLKAFWPMNERAGSTTIHDISGNGFDGTLTSGSGIVTVGNAGLLNSDNNTAAVGTGASNAGYISLPDLGIASGSFSIEFWLYPTGSNHGSGGSLDAGSIYTPGISGPRIIWRVTNDNKILVQMPGADNFINNTNLTTNKRWHYVFVWDGSLERAYLNGAADGTRTPGVTPTWSGAGVLFICGVGNQDYFLIGTIQNLAVYTKALSAGSVSAHYTVGTQGRVKATGRTLATR